MDAIQSRFILDDKVVTKYRSGIVKNKKASKYKNEVLVNIPTKYECSRICANKILSAILESPAHDYIFNSNHNYICGCNL